VHGGIRALRLGIVEGANVNSFSAVQQEVMIPETATSVKLTWWHFTMHEPDPGEDQQELVLWRADIGTELAHPWQGQMNNREWRREVVDLSAYRGAPLVIYFNVYNDGVGGRSAMYLDDVSLLACRRAASPVPTATWTPSPVPLPTATSTPIPPLTPTRRPTPTTAITPTPTPMLSTATPTASATPTPKQAALTATPTTAVTSTPTPVLPTATPAATVTPTPTSVAPTATPTSVIILTPMLVSPTATPTAVVTPTPTPVVPTATPTTAVMPTPTPTPVPNTGVVFGIVFADLNGNSVLDPGEIPLADAQVQLVRSGFPIQTQVTLPDGRYRFVSVPPAQYTVRETDPPGYTSVHNSVLIVLQAGQEIRVDFADYPFTPTPTGTPLPTPTPGSPTATPTVTPTPTTTPTWTATFTPLPTPTPRAGCQNMLINPGFEEAVTEDDPGWRTYPEPYQPQRVSDKHHGGTWSMLLGSPSKPPVYSYSSVRQEVTIPTEAISASLSWWYWPVSSDNDGGDYLGAFLLTPSKHPLRHKIIDQIWRV
ncbi:MAG TPA: hypothetical protein EYP04_00635, partial [Anaerolineae bacterium]|nr:hypothetical protein [Anaerolineae bacterium]